LSGAIMSQEDVIPVAKNAMSRNDLIERGFSRQPLRIDVDVALCLAKILSGSEINSFHTFRSGSICYDWCSCVATSD
jgi:hypothetical protein